MLGICNDIYPGVAAMLFWKRQSCCRDDCCSTYAVRL